MPNRSRKRKNEAAGGIVGAVTQDIELTAEQIKETAHNAAVALGRLGGLKGGKSRAAKLSKKKRIDIARKAAAARGVLNEESRHHEFIRDVGDQMHCEGFRERCGRDG